MKNIWTWLVNPPSDGPASTLLLRLMTGGVFLWEGILKFVYVNQGVGRFTKLGFPFPDATATFVGGLEIIGGALVIICAYSERISCKTAQIRNWGGTGGRGRGDVPR